MNFQCYVDTKRMHCYSSCVQGKLSSKSPNFEFSIAKREFTCEFLDMGEFKVVIPNFEFLIYSLVVYCSEVSIQGELTVIILAINPPPTKTENDETWHREKYSTASFFIFDHGFESIKTVFCAVLIKNCRKCQLKGYWELFWTVKGKWGKTENENNCLSFWWTWVFSGKWIKWKIEHRKWFFSVPKNHFKK